jgi:integrase
MELASARFRRLGHHLFCTGLIYELVAMKGGYERIPSRCRRCVRDSAAPLLDNSLRLNRRVSPRKRRRDDGVSNAVGDGEGGRRRMPKSQSRKRKSPKRVLALPDLEQAKTAVLNSLTSASGQRTYEHAIREFVAWYCSEPRLAFNRTVVLRYRIHLEQRHYAPATINLRLAAVRRIAYEAADAGLLSPELAAGIRRVKGVRRLGVRLGNWLTPEQGRRLLEHSTPSTPRALRDHAMVAMLIGCGLRRAELLALTLESVQQREEHGDRGFGWKGWPRAHGADPRLGQRCGRCLD